MQDLNLMKSQNLSNIYIIGNDMRAQHISTHI